MHSGPVVNPPIYSTLNLTLRQCTFPTPARRNQARSWTCRLSTIGIKFYQLAWNTQKIAYNGLLRKGEDLVEL